MPQRGIRASRIRRPFLSCGDQPTKERGIVLHICGHHRPRLLHHAGVPKEQLAQLRAGFDSVVRDAKFLEDVHKTGIEYDPMAGEALQKFIEGSVFDPEIIKTAKEVRGGQ